MLFGDTRCFPCNLDPNAVHFHEFSNISSQVSIIDTFWPARTWWRNQMETFFAFVRGNHRSLVWFPSKASVAELWCFLWSRPKLTIEQTIETPVIWDATALIMASLSWWGGVFRFCFLPEKSFSSLSVFAAVVLCIIGPSNTLRQRYINMRLYVDSAETARSKWNNNSHVVHLKSFKNVSWGWVK